MSDTAKHRSSLFWTYLATFLRIGNAVLVLPLAILFFNSVELLFALTFMNLTAFTQAIDFGVNNTIVRKTAYAYAGSNEERYGFLPVKEVEYVQVDTLAKLIISSKMFYAITSCVLVIFFLLADPLLLAKIPGAESVTHYRTAWILFFSAFIINFYFSFMTAISFGRGDIAAVGRVNSTFGAVYVFLCSPLIVWGCGVLSFGVAALVAAIVSRTYALYVFSSCEFTRQAKELKVKISAVRSSFASLISNAWRFGLVMIAIFIIMRAPFLYIAKEFGEEVTFLVIAWQIVNFALVFSQVPYHISFPKLNENFVQYGILRNRNLLPFIIISCLILYFIIALGALVSYFGATFLFDFNARLNFLVFLGILIIVFLELNHGLCSNFVTVQNRVPLYKRVLASAISVLFLVYFFIDILEMPAESVLIAIFISQFSFNNLYWPIHVSALLNMSPLKMYARGYFLFKSFVYRRLRS